MRVAEGAANDTVTNRPELAPLQATQKEFSRVLFSLLLRCVLVWFVVYMSAAQPTNPDENRVGEVNPRSRYPRFR